MLRSKPRHAEALKTAAGIGGFAPFAGEVAQGLAVHETAGAVVAVLAEVSINKDQGIAVDRIFCAVGCGRVVNPDLVRPQIEGGGIIWLSGDAVGGGHWSEGVRRAGRAGEPER